MKFRLAANESISLEGDARQIAIVCLHGELWLTQQGDANDYLFQPGENFTISHRGLW